MSKSIKIRLVATAATAAMLSACATVGPDFEQPAAPATTGYAMAGDAAPVGVAMTAEARQGGPWWDALGSPDLDRAIRQALTDNPTVAEATAAVERAQADLTVIRGGQGVQVDANGGASRQRINTQAFGFNFPSPTINLFTIGAGVSYDLDLFGGERRANEGARARLESQQRRADAAYLTLSGNIALQAVKVAQLRAEIDTVNAVIASDLRQIEMIQRATRAGGAAPSDATAGQAQLAQDEAQLPELQRDLAAARHQLALLVGKSPGDWTAPNFDLAGFTIPATVPVTLPSSLVRQRPDILAAEAELHSATAAIGVATADLYPDVSLNVGLTQTSIRPENLFSTNSMGWNIGPSVRIPLFDRTAKARREVAVADAKTSLARYQGTVLRAFLQVSDAMSALASDQTELTTLARAETTAKANVSDTQKAYDLGGGPLYNVVDAQRGLARVLRQKAEAQGRMMEHLVQLYTATGANWRA